MHSIVGAHAVSLVKVFTRNVQLIKPVLLVSFTNISPGRNLTTFKTMGDNNIIPVLRRCDNIEKSPQDKRLYRGLELSNKMRVLLVSDPTTDKSAASMDVNVGYLSDPDNIPGLAHFCEHMLFLGTEKYPNENDYNKFLSEHGGASNACTYPDHTNYYFDIIPEHLQSALDRFAQFFLSPLFTESATQREINAVNSEHEKNVSNDMWRMDQLDKHTANAEHPFHKFGTGNSQTLDVLPKEKGIDIRKELLKFHDTYYSSNIMALAILGKESLDELEAMVVKLFSNVQDKAVTAPIWTEHPFTQDQLQTIAYMVPIKDIRNLNVIFPAPDLREFYKSGPGNYISHLIGHEGPGSLLSALKARGWSNNLVAGSRPAPRGFGFFGISVDLTEDGMNHIEDIVKLIFQYINMLRDTGCLEWIQNEHKDIQAMHFLFKDKESPRSYISNVVHNLHYLPLEEILTGYYILSDWRPDIVTQLINEMTPENVRVGVIAKKYAGKTDQVEPWYGTEYSLDKLSENVLKEWRENKLCPELKMPVPNEFIPTNFDLYPLEVDSKSNKRSCNEISDQKSPAGSPTNTPEHSVTSTQDKKIPCIIHDTALSRFWFKQDDEFLLPKANLMFDFVSPLAYLDPMNCNLTHMLVALFRDSLNEYMYAAELAGLKWELTNTKYGLILAVGGYNHKQQVLLDKILEKLTNFKVDPKRFAILKENYIRTLKNFEAEQPYQHAVYYLAVLLTEHSWTKQELLSATDQLTLERLEAFIPQILSRMHVEGLFHGNINKEMAKEVINLVETRLTSAFNMTPLLPRQLLLNRELKLENECNYVYEVINSVHKSSCVELYYQCGVQAKETNMMLELFAQMIQEPCFNILRTKQQLGYIVFSGIRRSNGVQGLRVIVQSDKHPLHVDQRIEHFLMEMLEYIEKMTPEEFTRHKDALAAQRLEKPKQLSAQSHMYWAEITAQQYHFDRANVEVAYLNTLTKQDVVDFYKDLLAVDAKQRHKIAVYVISMSEGGAGTQLTPTDADNGHILITDVTGFKSCHGMHPLVQPYINITRKGNRCKL